MNNGSSPESFAVVPAPAASAPPSVASGGSAAAGDAGLDLSWSALPRRIRFSLSEDGSPLKSHLMATFFAGDDDITSFLESRGLSMGSPEWLHMLAVFQHLISEAQQGSVREWKRRAVTGLATHSCFASPPSELFRPAVPSTEWLATKSGAKRLLVRWTNRRTKALALAGSEGARAKVEADELGRWRSQLVQILKDCQFPVCSQALFAADPDKVLQATAGTVRASTLRARIREWSKFSIWVLAVEARLYPSNIGLLLDYIEERREEPCSRTRLRAILSAVSFVERAGGVPKNVMLSSQPLVLSLVNVRTAELEVGAPPTRQAVPFPLILIISLELAVGDNSLPRYLRALAWCRLLKLWTSSRADDLQGASFDNMVITAEGLRGYFDRTKTSGAGRRVRFLPFFIARESWLVNRRWLDQGFDIWTGPEFNFKRDYMIPRPTRNFKGCRAILASYNDVSAAFKHLLRALRKPVLEGGSWGASTEPLCPSEPLVRVFTEHSERCTMATLASWAGIDRERREYLGRWKILESSDVYVRSAWQIVTSLQIFVVRALARSDELQAVGIIEVQERLISGGLDKAKAEALSAELGAPKMWGQWKSQHLPQARDLPAPPQTPAEQIAKDISDFRFFISVVGKKGLRRLHRKGACNTKPERLVKCEYFMSIEGVSFDAECKHCFRPEQPTEGGPASGEFDEEDESSSSTSSGSAGSSSD